MAKIAKGLIIKAVRGYQRFISPLLGNNCRFQPTCSEYFLQAVDKYGVFKGFYLGSKRILRCHPFNPGGSDPLP